MDRIVFRSAFQGYNKQEVEAFLVKLTAEHSAKAASMAAQEKQLKDEINDLREKLRAAHAKNAELEAKAAAPQVIKAETESGYSAEQKQLFQDMGEKLFIADQRAREIVESAEQKAEMIVAEAERKAAKNAAELQQQAEQKAGRVLRTLEQFEKSETEIASSLAKLRELVKTAGAGEKA